MIGASRCAAMTSETDGSAPAGGPRVEGGPAARAAEQLEQQRIADLRVGEQADGDPEDGGHRGHEQRVVELEVRARDRVPAVRLVGQAQRAHRQGGAARGVVEQAREDVVQLRRVARGDQLGRPGRGDVGEAADVGEHERHAEAQRGEEDARLLDLAVGQHGEVGAAEERRGLALADEALDEAHAGRRGGAQRRGVHARGAHDPQLGVLDPLPRLDEHVDALVGAQQAEAQHDGAVVGGQLGRQRGVAGRAQESRGG